MMGAFETEVDEVLQNSKANLRIAGFDEEEKRLRQRMYDGPHNSLKLPQGPYTFSGFRTLTLPGIEVFFYPTQKLYIESIFGRYWYIINLRVSHLLVKQKIHLDAIHSPVE